MEILDVSGSRIGLSAFSIGAVQGAPSADVQRLMLAFAQKRRHGGLRVVGALQVPAMYSAERADEVVLLDLYRGETFPVFQDLGKDASGCTVDPSGIAGACHAVLEAISAGADLVVLSKFGKLEEGGSGFLQAFGAAAEAGIPCLTGVAPAYAAAFTGFASHFARWLEATETALEDWWLSSQGQQPDY